MSSFFYSTQSTKFLHYQSKFIRSIYRFCFQLNDLWLTTDDAALFDWLVDNVFGPDGALGIDCIECGPWMLCGAPGCPIGTILVDFFSRKIVQKTMINWARMLL